MSNLFLKHFFYISLVIFSNLSLSENLILVPENILDVRSGKLIKAKVYIEDGIIKSISQDEEDFKTAKIIELSGITLMPGLMDAHVHLIGNNELHGYQSMSESSQMATIYGVKNAKNTLLAGFTTVRNVGAGYFADVALRDAIKQGVVIGPTMLVSGPSLSISGGHGDNNLLPFSSDNHSHKHNIVDNPWDARKAVRINRKYGADLIKFTATGGVMSKNTDVNAKQFTYDEMKALVDEAHSHGMKVAAHAHGLKGIKVAIMAGVDSIEHSSYIDKATIQLAIDKGTYLSMDIYVSDYILGEGSKKGILEESLAKERKVGKLQRENFKAANSMGANMVFGTDAGIYPHGDNAKQFKYMVQWGMTPLEAIQASTINTAQLFGLSYVGELKKGFKADIIGIRGNPLKQIDLLEDVVFVMKEGLIYKN
ncbi:MAG: amidohydrolase family protein [SAR86 cluster bacterium]|uniref:Amidohydrolase family protein n=1 Tax=SAR86 cluster bacterium TaxID=2030880 RepID=A0A520M5A4_9GAMM|nr:MAG: amidohydrolase family protein [SAR86 cluster bacterium]